MQIVRARGRWIEGYPDQALAMVLDCISAAESDGPFAICHGLALAACPISLWTGDFEAAATYIDQLLHYSRRYMLDRWNRLGEGYREILDRKRNGSFNQRGAGGFVTSSPASIFHHEMLVTIDEEMVSPELAIRAQEGRSGWCNPEILRSAGEMCLREGGSKARETAKSYFRRALEDATAQEANSWRLRAALSLASVLREMGGLNEALDILGEALGAFTEGHATADLQRAHAMRQELRANLLVSQHG